MDGLPYEPFLVQHDPWEKLLCSLFSRVLERGVVPRFWRLGIVAPIPKPGDPAHFDSWRPITLLSCMGKLFEHILLRRIAPILVPALSPSQAGFQVGADQQAFALVEGLRTYLALRGRRSVPRVAFIDIRKAFDCVWRDGLLWKLCQRGVHGAEWHAVAALLKD